MEYSCFKYVTFYCTTKLISHTYTYIEQFRLKLKKVWKTTRPFRYYLNQISYDYTVEVMNRFKGLDLLDRVPEGLWMEIRYNCTGGGNQNHPKGEMQKGKVVIWGDLTNSWEKKRSERQRRKENIYPTECRVHENIKER